MSRYFLGIDVWMTGAKALLIDEEGAVAASATTALTLQTPRPLWSEQDPREWWKGTAASVRRALAHAGAKGEDVAAVGLNESPAAVAHGRGPGERLHSAHDGRGQMGRRCFPGCILQQDPRGRSYSRLHPAAASSGCFRNPSVPSR